MHQQLQLPPNSPINEPPLRPELPIQTSPNPNNKGVQQDDTLNLPAYYIAPTKCNKLNLRYGKIIDTKIAIAPIITEQFEEEVPPPKTEQPEPEILIQVVTPIGSTQQMQLKTHIEPRLATTAKDTPPYSKRLSIAKTSQQLEFDMLGEL